MPASVENLFPRSSAATPCGTNRNLQQENHSNFTVASPHSPNTMAPGRHHDIRRDLPPISGAALLPIADSRSVRIPAGRTGVSRPGCRRFQSHTDPDPQACVVDRDQSPPWKSRSRRSHLLPHVAALSLHNGFYHSSQLSHPRFHVPVLLASHPTTDTPSHVFDQTGHGGRQTRIGRRVYCRCVQSVHGPNRAWGTGFVEILFTTQPSTISRGSIHGA